MLKPQTRSLAFINNKGGVGKTTLACNMAYHLSNESERNILVVDLDPQCNATQLLLSDLQWDELYGEFSQKDDPRSVLHALRQIRRGDSGIDETYKPVRSERFQVDVLPGHPSLALLEDTFSSSWESFVSGDLGGARRTHWVAELVRGATDYDLVILDAGPSLGALNRTVLVGADYFVTPTAADLFSLFAIDNIGEWIKKWSRKYETGLRTVHDEYSDDFDFSFPADSKLDATYLGYTIQQYVSKTVSGGQRRTVNAYDKFKRQIPAKARKLAGVSGRAGETLDLGIVPHMFAMVPLAQSRHAPIAALVTSDGLRGAQISQQAKYRSQLEEIGLRLKHNLDIAEGWS
ncbi:ParA family protein [Paenarthrobacter sp. NPDC089989]|uniref:ParA family protein n=1 Tax=unclassified Paenarthrobacter TaxID=2634190 RepID=UPI0037FD1EB7